MNKLCFNIILIEKFWLIKTNKIIILDYGHPIDYY